MERVRSKKGGGSAAPSSRVKRAEKRAEAGGNYFAQPKTDLKFVHSGSKMFDLALGGGWAVGRVANIVGDKSTGKTLLCIEAAANFADTFKKGIVHYREAESAFDIRYAQALGMPVDRVDFGSPIATVEDLFKDLRRVLDKAKHPTLYIVDSLDALSDEAELERDFSEGSYGTAKAKGLSKLFRMVIDDIAAAEMTVLIISQVRSKIGLSFGRNTTRSGGRALDFYASQVAYLQHVKTLTRTVRGSKRASGVSIRVKCDKNKVALPFREAAFDITFGYGIDDVASCLDWLTEVRYLDDLNLTPKGVNAYLEDLAEMPWAEFKAARDKIHAVCEKRWFEIEEAFLPKVPKYGRSDV